MRLASGHVGQVAPGAGSQAAHFTDSGSIFSGRMGSGLLIALLLHVAFVLWAYLRPPPPLTKKSKPIVVEVLKPKPKPVVEEPPPPPKVDEPKPPEPPQKATPQPASRPLPKELRPVTRATPDDASSPAIVVPQQPPEAPTTGPATGEIPKGPINLFPKSLAGVVGAAGFNGKAIPKGPDRLFKDERLEEKKEPDFVLHAEKGGGYRCDAKNFIAHIKPDGKIEFENRFPIGFNKGGTFSFDLTDLAMRGAKQDPYAADKRRFLDFSKKLREDLMTKSIKEGVERSSSQLKEQLHAIWNSGRSGAARRREIFEKWQDCDDDKAEVSSRKGRHVIEDFIKTYLPEDSPDAYTSEELQKLNADRGELSPFSPYRLR